jgi:hypothetical protein
VIPERDSWGKHTNSPCNHDGAKPLRRAGPLHHDIGWHLGGDVKREENRKGNVVIQAFHAEILLKTSKTGISNVATIEEGEPRHAVRKLVTNATQRSIQIE